MVIRHAAVETFTAVNYVRPKIVRLRAGGQEEKENFALWSHKRYRFVSGKNFLRLADGSEQPSGQFTLKVNYKINNFFRLSQPLVNGKS